MYSRNAPPAPNLHARDDRLAEQLHEVSLNLVGLSEGRRVAVGADLRP